MPDVVVRIVVNVPFQRGFLKSLVRGITDFAVKDALETAIKREAMRNQEVDWVTVDIEKMDTCYRVVIKICPRAQFRAKLGRLLGLTKDAVRALVAEIVAGINRGLADKMEGYFGRAFGYGALEDHL
eukprot:m.250427 g.250427  ORF g.250427 m.250427 type:complete len:127 (-) comp16718_c0_seq1:457-837(-)